MQQQPQIPLIHLVVPLHALPPVRQHADLGRQDRDLHLAAAGVLPGAGGLLVGRGHGGGVKLGGAQRPRPQEGVRRVPAEGGDAPLRIGLRAGARGGVAEGEDAR